MAGEFDFGDLSNFSLFGGESSGPSFGGDYSLNVPSLQETTALPSGPNLGGFAPLPTAPEAGGKPGVLTPFANLAKEAAPFVQLGTSGLGLAAGVKGAQTAATNAATGRRAQRLQENVAGQQAAAAAPLTEFGKKTLEASTSGPVPPAVEAEIQQMLQGWIQKARDFAARSGQGDSLMLSQWENYLQGQAETLRQKWREEQQGLGIQSLSQGANALGGAGSTAGNIQTGAQSQGAATAALISEVNRALASLTGGAS